MLELVGDAIGVTAVTACLSLHGLCRCEAVFVVVAEMITHVKLLLLLLLTRVLRSPIYRY